LLADSVHGSSPEPGSRVECARSLPARGGLSRLSAASGFPRFHPFALVLASSEGFAVGFVPGCLKRPGGPLRSHPRRHRITGRREMFTSCRRSRALLRVAALSAVCAAALLVTDAARGDFKEPVRLTDGSGRVTETALSIDVANNAYIVSVVGGTVQVDLLGPDLRAQLEVPEVGEEQESLDVSSNSRGQIVITFRRRLPEQQETREVVITTNGGGGFTTPARLSEIFSHDHGPRLDLDANGDPHLIYTRLSSGADPARWVYHYNRLTNVETEVARGSHPAIHVDQTSVIHLAYFRNRNVYYRCNASGSFGPEELVVTTAAEDISEIQIGVDRQGNILVVYASQGSLYVAHRTGGMNAFSPPRMLDTGDVTDPEMHVRPSGVLTIVYSKSGDIYYIQGLSTFLLAQARVGEATPEVESNPSVRVDLLGNLHICFLRDGETYYTNNAGSISADFSASPRSGEAPMNVSFQDLSSGPIQKWSWDFGDGSGSAQRNPDHLYAEPGKYTVSLKVFNADLESEVVKEDFIIVEELYNSLTISDQRVLPNQSGVWFPVIAAHNEPIQAYQIHAVFDPNILTLTEVTRQFTVVGSAVPDVWECNIYDHRVELGVMFELNPPFISPELPPAQRHTLAQLIFDISNDAPQGGVTELRLVNNSQISRIFNIFTVDGFTKLPRLRSSRIEILPLWPLPKFFLRGDADGSGRLEITDAIRILGFLFLGAEPPPCEDAADVTDSGRIDISSAISLLNFLFLGGGQPAVPFPHLGIDPTPDGLHCP
ncbi:MAG: PKD domain-containing protein, partial [Planctomycetes bacterium]|nr:PKD domain-containing protein [Planctomycetota bacterium]